MSPKHHINRYNNNNVLWKPVGLKKNYSFSPFQSSSSLSISASFYICRVFYTFFYYFFEPLFNVSLCFVAVSSLRTMMNFVAQLMVTMILSTCSRFNPLSPNSDQQQFSPNNIHTLSRDKVMRINKMIIIEKIPWSCLKFSQLILKVDVWRSVWRICMWILGLDIILIS